MALPRLLKPEQVADELCIETKTLANWRSQRIGPPYLKLNGAVRYAEKELTEWLAAQQVARPA